MACGAFAQETANRPRIAVSIDVPSTNVYCNQEFRLTYVVFLEGVRAGNRIGVSSLPDSSLLVMGELQEMPTSRTIQEGQVRELRRFFCTARATRQGPIEIAPTLSVEVFTGRRGFFGEEEIGSVNVRARPTILDVMAIPDKDKPPSFSGAVGRFSMEVDASPTNVMPGSLIHVATKITGTGFLETVVAPRITSRSGLKTYEPKQTAALPTEMAFEQVVITEAKLVKALPELVFSYFDPDEGKYVTLTKGPFPLSFLDQTNTVVAVEPYRPEGNGKSSQTTELTIPKLALASATRSSVAWWIVLAIASLVVVACLWLFPARTRSASIAKTILLSILLASALFAFFVVTKVYFFENNRGIVVIAGSARFAPAPSAQASFDLPAGAQVEVISIHGDWAKVSFKANRGWVPSDTLRRQ